MKHSFKEAYDVLQKHAATLRDQSEPNIDDLLHIVEESVAAYKICQSRIDAVEKALDKALGQVDDLPVRKGTATDIALGEEDLSS
jgi:exodeoxyribonuclease VII small subunit